MERFNFDEVIQLRKNRVKLFCPQCGSNNPIFYMIQEEKKDFPFLCESCTLSDEAHFHFIYKDGAWQPK